MTGMNFLILLLSFRLAYLRLLPLMIPSLTLTNKGQEHYRNKMWEEYNQAFLNLLDIRIQSLDVLLPLPDTFTITGNWQYKILSTEYINAPITSF